MSASFNHQMPFFQTLRLGAAQREAAEFQQRLRGAYARFETAGTLRRWQEGPPELVHVVIPAAPPLAQAGETAHDNAMWERLSALLHKGTLVTPPGAPQLPEGEARVFVAMHGLWRHTIVLATVENWGMRLAEQTGPTGYWRMLLNRLKEAGALTIHNGHVVAIDRSAEPAVHEVIPCRQEEDFFRLARTPFKSPRFRFARPDGLPEGHWRRGMLPEHYPPGLRIYVDPRQPGMFDNSRPSHSHPPHRCGRAKGRGWRERF